MATITKRKSGWSVQIRRKGYQPEYRTLPTKAAAEKWARERESEIDRGDAPVDRKTLLATTLGDLMRRYMDEITPTKKSAHSEQLRMTKMLSAPMCELSLLELSSAPISAYRDQRLQTVKAGTVARELSLIHTVIDVARRDWGYQLPTNPIALVRKPRIQNARDRRLRPGELKRLEAALVETRNPFIRPLILLAVETALRRSELLKLQWRYIDRDLRTAHIPDTKTGHPRTIPLTDQALFILDGLEREDDRVFPITTMALKLAWNRLRIRAGIPDLRLHDLRHEAISRFSEMGLTTIELSVISGHRDPRMLFRYAHLRPSDLARKLSGRSWRNEVCQ